MTATPPRSTQRAAVGRDPVTRVEVIEDGPHRPKAAPATGRGGSAARTSTPDSVTT